MTNESKASRSFVHSLFSTGNLQLALGTWDKNDRASGIVYLYFYGYTLIAGNSATVLWVRGLKSIEIMAAFDEQLFSKQYPSECPQTPLSLRCKCLEKHILCTRGLEAADRPLELPNCFLRNLNSVALGIAALARHGINNLVRSVSADPNIELCSVLSISSPWWSWQKCTKTGMTWSLNCFVLCPWAAVAFSAGGKSELKTWASDGVLTYPHHLKSSSTLWIQLGDRLNVATLKNT